MANQSNQSFVISDDEILRKNTIDTNQIEILDIVGKGNFGIVNKGKQKFSEVRPRCIYNPNMAMGWTTTLRDKHCRHHIAIYGSCRYVRASVPSR